jgi:hypothetical protein
MWQMSGFRNLFKPAFRLEEFIKAADAEIDRLESQLALARDTLQLVMPYLPSFQDPHGQSMLKDGTTVDARTYVQQILDKLK